MKFTSFAARTRALGLVSGTALLVATSASAHFIGVVGNNSIDGSLCVGFDCVAEEAFGFDTIRMKENNVRLDYQDTSVAASFPPNDWRVIINDSANGGANHYSIEDRSAGNQVLRVFAGARNNALVVDSQGDVGLGTTTPATDIDIKIGDTPTVRLQQDGTSGFTPQTWDVAGNETNFFVRDATGGSTLPFRIRTTAPTSSIDIASDGDVGVGTASPAGKLHTRGSGVQLVYFESTDNAVQVRMRTDSENRRFLATNSADAVQTQIVFNDDSIQLAGPTNAGADLWAVIDANGITTQGPTCGAPCDAVFDRDAFTVPSIEEHAAYMWENMHLAAVGPTGPDQPFNVTEKTAGMLHELEVAHIYIAEQNEVIKSMGADLETLTARLAQLEEQLQD